MNQSYCKLKLALKLSERNVDKLFYSLKKSERLQFGFYSVSRHFGIKLLFLPNIIDDVMRFLTAAGTSGKTSLKLLLHHSVFGSTAPGTKRSLSSF